jgi:hypothetical protein
MIAMRTYGSKPRRITSTDLWDGNRDVPRRRPLAENNNEINEPKNDSGSGSIVKGVVGWLSPKKSRGADSPTVPAPETAKKDDVESLSEDDENNVSVASSTGTADTLIASTPNKDKLDPEIPTGIDLLLQFCLKNEILQFNQYVDDLLVDATLRKLGEATYSEVFVLTEADVTTTVLKIIPLTELTADGKGSSTTTIEDILQEIRISRRMV